MHICANFRIAQMCILSNCSGHRVGKADFIFTIKPSLCHQAKTLTRRGFLLTKRDKPLITRNIGNDGILSVNGGVGFKAHFAVKINQAFLGRPKYYKTVMGTSLFYKSGGIAFASVVGMSCGGKNIADGEFALLGDKGAGYLKKHTHNLTVLCNIAYAVGKQVKKSVVKPLSHAKGVVI